MKYIIVLLLSSLCLASCAKISYQARHEFTPNGYSGLHIEGDTYRISYETYKRKATEVLLTEMAEYRAAELTLERSNAFFEIISVNFTETMEDYDVPEQRIRQTYGGGTSRNSGFDAGIIQPKITEEIIIPAHVRQFKIKRADMEIKISVDKNSDRAKFAQSIIDERTFR
jgi:hypothetical protein